MYGTAYAVPMPGMFCMPVLLRSIITVLVIPRPPSWSAYPSLSEGIPIKPAVKVGVYDANDNNVGVLDHGASVSLFLIAGTPGALLGGATTVTSTVGEAEFADLDVQTAGTGYRLTADVSGMSVNRG